MRIVRGRDEIAGSLRELPENCKVDYETISTLSGARGAGGSTCWFGMIGLDSSRDICCAEKPSATGSN
jgi:hypothetical protein